MTLNLATLFEAVAAAVHAVVRSPSGRADYRWAERVLTEKTPNT